MKKLVLIGLLSLSSFVHADDFKSYQGNVIIAPSTLISYSLRDLFDAEQLIRNKKLESVRTMFSRGIITLSPDEETVARIVPDADYEKYHTAITYLFKVSIPGLGDYWVNELFLTKCDTLGNKEK